MKVTGLHAQYHLTNSLFETLEREKFTSSGTQQSQNTSITSHASLHIPSYLQKSEMDTVQQMDTEMDTVECTLNTMTLETTEQIDTSTTPSNNQRNQLAKWESDEPLGNKSTIAMVLYSNQNYPNLKSEYPEWTDRIKQIAKIWMSLPNEKRQPYVQQARENRTKAREILQTKPQ